MVIVKNKSSSGKSKLQYSGTKTSGAVVLKPDDDTLSSSSSTSTCTNNLATSIPKTAVDLANEKSREKTATATKTTTATTTLTAGRRHVQFDLAQTQYHHNECYCCEEIEELHLWYNQEELQEIKKHRKNIARFVLKRQKQAQQEQADETMPKAGLTFEDAMDALYRVGFNPSIDPVNISNHVDFGCLREMARDMSPDGSTLPVIQQYIGLERHVIGSYRADLVRRRKMILVALYQLQGQPFNVSSMATSSVSSMSLSTAPQSVESYKGYAHKDGKESNKSNQDDDDDEGEALRLVCEDISRPSRVFARVLAESCD